MIVRISGEDQYRLRDSDAERLNEREIAVATAADSGDEHAFAEAYGALLDFVRASGELVGDEELDGSDVILPPADITLAEASVEFSGEGLIPD
jgi:hypothetical protein